MVLLAAGVLPGYAQNGVYPEPERCPRFVADLPLRKLVVPASYVLPVQAAGRDVTITFIGHSTFLIESPAGVRIATDYNDSVRPPVTPDIATMNRAHITHYSAAPDPGIAHVLRGWGEGGEPVAWDLTVKDVWVRNVTTNLRGGFGFGGFGDGFNDGFGGGAAGGTQRDANSIFVFEVAGLCIAHLGHLHHELTADHLDALGRIDVVLAPVDGSRTLSTDDMIDVLRNIQAPLVVPMHFFGMATLDRFLAKMQEYYDVERTGARSITVSRESLPKIPTVMVLSGF